MIYAIAAVLALILDQAVKYWTTVNIVVDTGEAKLLPGLLHLANVHNTGAAFSFLEGARWFFVVVCILFVAIVIYALSRDIITGKLARWSAVAVMAGAIGNCIDRIVCGYVVDMFEFDFLILGKRFPVFNVADIYITVGVIIFCLCILLEKPKAPAQRSTTEPAGADTAAPEQPKAEKKPLFAPRHKTPIPDFPKREKSADAPAVDPEDPFAEWERRARSSAPAAQTDTAQEPVVYTQPVKAEPAPQVSFETPAAPAEKPADPPAEPAEISPDSFNLEDILAEFKDD